MRALVTGGAGFIGSTLVDRLLAEGHEVDVVDDLSTGALSNLAAARTSGGALTFHQIDIRQPEIVELVTRRRPEVVFHLAAQSTVPRSLDDPVFDADVNTIGSLRVLEAARAARARKVVFAASGGSLYGDVDTDELPVPETHRYDPRSPYAISKRNVLDYLAFYRDVHGLEYSALALANVYGPRQNAEGEGGVVSIFCARFAAHERCTINGDGEQTRDFVFVDDVVDAFSRAAERGSGLVINIATGIETSVNEIYRAVAEAFSSEAAPRYTPERPGEVRRSVLDPSRAELHLGFRAWTTLRDGVAAVADAHRARVHSAER